MARAVDHAGWQQLGQAVQRALADTPVPGAVLGLDGPGGCWLHSVGHGLGADSLLRVSSLTKPIVAAATLSAAQDGVFALADPVDRWLPELATPSVLRQPDSALTDTVTAQHRLRVEDLLTMRLGTGFAYEQPDSASGPSVTTPLVCTAALRTRLLLRSGLFTVVSTQTLNGHRTRSRDPRFT